jgi:hypothetical protein
MEIKPKETTPIHYNEPDAILSTEDNEFFRISACNGKHWVIVLKVIKLSGNFSVGINGDT